mgnify:CR=1 FL=1
MDEGFVDLRYRGDAGNGNDSFWPSFTDIMMVVVMIFMLASTFLMVRNWDLVRELRATIEAEREAEALARSMTETSATLEERLAHAQHEISELRMQLMRANELNQSLQTQLGDTGQRLQTAESERDRLATDLKQARREVQLADDRHRQLSDAYATLEQRLLETLAEVDSQAAGGQSPNRTLVESRARYHLSQFIEAGRLADEAALVVVSRGAEARLSVGAGSPLPTHGWLPNLRGAYRCR